MTSAPVMSPYISQTMGNIGATQVRPQGSGSDFKSFMEKPSDTPKTEKAVKSEIKSQKTEDTKPENSAIDTDVKADKKPDVSKKVDKKVIDEKTAETKDVVEKVESSLSEELGVSKEQIEEALSILGLTAAALLDQEVMPKLVAELTGKDDVIDLATDEDIFGKLMTVSKTAEDALAEVSELLDVTPEELSKIVSTLEKMSEETSSKTENHPEEAGDDFRDIMATTENNVAEPQKDDSFESKIQLNGEQSQKESNPVNNNVYAVNEQAAETVSKEASERIDKVQRNEDFQDFGKDSQTMNFAQSIISRVTEIFNESAGADKISYSNLEVENIINQLTDSIKANISNEMSEINMRLHPETLGTVSVKLSANSDGLVTATFTAQNEAVKAVIESQAAVLRDALEAKGTTVEAIEVTVQSHGFERDLSNQNREQSNGETGRGRRNVRRINLTDAIPEDESDDDALVREMMAQNGNTIDYSA